MVAVAGLGVVARAERVGAELAVVLGAAVRAGALAAKGVRVGRGAILGLMGEAMVDCGGEAGGWAVVAGADWAAVEATMELGEGAAPATFRCLRAF